MRQYAHIAEAAAAAQHSTAPPHDTLAHAPLLFALQVDDLKAKATE